MSKEKWFINESELDDYQYSVKNLNTEKSYIISGSAGSGKTVLALWRAKELEGTKKRNYFIIVYTKALRQFIEDGIRQIDINSERVLYAWEWENRLNSPDADYIIIDEAQDFTQTEISNFYKKSNKSIMLFGDSAQQLYKSKKVVKNGSEVDEETMSIAKMVDFLHLPLRELTFNYRLPKKIALFAEFIGKYPVDLADRCKKEEGSEPVVRKCRSRDEELDYIIKTIRSHHHTDVGIVLPYKKDVRYVYEYFNKKGMNPEAKLNTFNANLMSLDFKSENPKIMPYHSSKGLQFEVVFVPFCEINDDFFQNPLYVAITRATSELHITFSGELSQYIKRIPKQYYKFVEIKTNKRESPF